MPHMHPDRSGDVVVEVVRDGEVLATIYGSREGVHLVSDLVERNRPFGFAASEILPSPSWVLPLLRDGDLCPWCSGARVLGDLACPVCAWREQ
jgi:hypothetical protein